MPDLKSNWPLSGINLNTTIIQMRLLDQTIGSASGFFFKHQEVLYLVTNRHVVIKESTGFYPDSIEIILHVSTINPKLNHRIVIPLYKSINTPNWYEHPNYQTLQCDVVLIPMSNQLNHCCLNYMTNKNFLGDRKLGACADVVIVGYPLGFYDEVNNLPVYRQGMIASPHPQKFEDKPYFLIDANLHPGTSGSMVINSPHNLLYRNENGPVFHSNDGILLGIHSAEHLVGGDPLGLNVVWYPGLIVEIAEANK